MNAFGCLSRSYKNWFLPCRFKFSLFMCPRRSVNRQNPKPTPLLPAYRILNFSLNHGETRLFPFSVAKHVRKHFPHSTILLLFYKAHRNFQYSQTEGNIRIACGTSHEHGFCSQSLQPHPVHVSCLMLLYTKHRWIMQCKKTTSLVGYSLLKIPTNLLFLPTIFGASSVVMLHNSVIVTFNDARPCLNSENKFALVVPFIGREQAISSVMLKSSSVPLTNISYIAEVRTLSILLKRILMFQFPVWARFLSYC
jgi:hypothetical protein